MANEKRLIDVNDALEKLCEYCCCGCYEECDYRCSEFDNISNIPTVDAVEVVRCKDCKHYDNSEGIQWCHLNSKFYKWGSDWHSFPADGFCSYGERKDNE